jgi:hypothetical protein
MTAQRGLDATDLDTVNLARWGLFVGCLGGGCAELNAGIQERLLKVGELERRLQFCWVN